MSGWVGDCVWGGGVKKPKAEGHLAFLRAYLGTISMVLSDTPLAKVGVPHLFSSLDFLHMCLTAAAVNDFTFP